MTIPLITTLSSMPPIVQVAPTAVPISLSIGCIRATISRCCRPLSRVLTIRPLSASRNDGTIGRCNCAIPAREANSSKYNRKNKSMTEYRPFPVACATLNRCNCLAATIPITRSFRMRSMFRICRLFLASEALQVLANGVIVDLRPRSDPFIRFPLLLFPGSLGGRQGSLAGSQAG